MSSAILIKDSTASSGFRRVDTGALGPQGQAGTSPQGFNPRGAWAPNTNYAPFDIVTYGGSTYESSTTFTSGTTFNAANWNLWAAKGIDGAAGSGGGAAPATPATTATTLISTGGTASASTTYTPGNYGAANAFDSDETTRWAATGAAATLSYNRGNGNGAVPGSVRLSPSLDGPNPPNDAPTSFNLKGRTDGGAWTTLRTVTGYTWANLNPVTFTFTNAASFTELQLDITASPGNVSLRRVQWFAATSAGTAGTVTGTDKLNLNSLAAPVAVSGFVSGTITKRIEIFDASGVSLGFIPVYDSIGS